MYLILVSISVLIGACICFAFNQISQKFLAEHRLHKTLLTQKIELHTDQVLFRQNALKRYDFQIYNLSEALIIQSEIIVTSF